MVELLSRYSKYMSLNKKEGIILLAQIAKISILSTMVLLTVQRINAMYRKLNADK